MVFKMRHKESAKFVLVLLLSGMLWPVNANAEVKDPAPVSDDALRYIYKALNAGVSNPLVKTINQRMDTLRTLLDRYAQYKKSNDDVRANEALGMLRAQSAELRMLRAELGRQLVEGGGLQPVATGAESKTASTRQNAKNAPVTAQANERFDRIIAALDNLTNSNEKNHAENLITLRQALDASRNRKASFDDIDLSAPLPNWGLEKPSTSNLDGLKQATEPAYVAASRKAPGNNIYAFLGDTLLAALPEATPVEASTCSYTTADLSQNTDIQLTPEIRALAEKLEYSPVKIFSYVSKEIAFEPYWGSLKGAQGTLISKAGGSTDQASLLIALLRASNIPARYVTGVVEFKNDDRVLQWVGAKDYLAAYKILGFGQFPIDAPIDRNLKFQHVWVQACVPYGNYRGTRVDKSGHRWIPLDPSFKEKTYQSGIAVDTVFDVQRYLAYRTNGADSLPHETYLRQMETAAKTLPPNFENNTIQDIPYQGKQVNRGFDILPASLPYRVQFFVNWSDAIAQAETAELPDTHRYFLEISGANLSSAISMTLPKINLNRVTLSYKAATSGDQDKLNNYITTGVVPGSSNGSCFLNNLPVINAYPVVRVDGDPVAQGITENIFNACNLKSYTTVTRILFGSRELDSATFGNKIKPVEHYALMFNAFQTADALLQQRAARLLNNIRANPDPNGNFDETVGEYLHLVGLKWMRYYDDAAKRLGAVSGLSGWNGHHLGMVSTASKAEYLFDLPFALSNSAGVSKGALIDIPHAITRSVDIATGQVIPPAQTLLLGFSGSALESFVWQENGRADAVSTVRGIQYANEVGIEVLTIDAANQSTEIPKLTSNADSSLNHTANMVSALQLAISQGFKITIPRSMISYGGWIGAVWLQLKEDGTGCFCIQGGYGGGASLDASPSFYVPSLFNLTDGSNPLILGTGFNYTNPNNANDRSEVIALTDGFAAISSYFNFSCTGGVTCSGDPVNMVTGNLYHIERDIAIKGRGGLPFVFERSYNSMDNVDGPLGFGWTHSFNQYLRFDDNNQNNQVDAADRDGITSSVTWVGGNGTRKYIQVQGNASGVPVGATFTAPKGFYFQATRNADGAYTIREQNGMVYRFENVPGTVGGQKARLLSIQDRNGNTLTLNYSAACGNNLCGVTDNLGRSLNFTYNAANRIQEIKDWTNRSFQYGYDGSGNLASFKNPLAANGSQNAVTYEYYTSDPKLVHAMKRYNLPRGNGMTFEYYANGKVFRHTTTAGESMSFTYNEFRRESASTNERGHTRRFFFDANANLVKLIEENGAERDYTYDPNDLSRRLSKRDPMGYMTQYTYDSRGNVVQVTNPSGSTLEYADFTPDFNLPQRVKDARGNWTVMQYDAKGNLTNTIKLKSGVTPAIPYAPSTGQIVDWTIHGYDAAGNRTSSKRVRDIAAQIGPVFSFTYDTSLLNIVNYKRQGDKDGNGSLDAVEVSPPLGYDDLGRPTADITSNWYPITKNYDSVDRITRMTDAVGNLRDFKYDPNGNPIEESLVLAPNGTNSLIDHSAAQYDISDRRTASLDAAGNVTAYAYDATGNVVKMTNPDSYSLALDYDEANRVVKAYDQEGHAVTKTLDLDGKPRSVTDPNGNTVRYEYYGSERDGRLKKVIDPAQRVTSYDHDPNGNVTRVTDNLGRETLTFYDELSRPTRIVGPVTTDLTLGQYRPVTRNSYDNLGNLIAVAAGRTDIVGTNSGADIVATQLTYTYDDFGRKIKETDALGKFWTFEYDQNNNLVKMTDAKNQVTRFTYFYGGLLQTRTDNSGKQTTYTYNALGQKLTSQTPEVTYSYAYDSAHRLISVTDSRGSKTLNYAYSPGGLLNTMRDSDNQRIDYLYDPVGRLSGIWAANDDYIAYTYDAGGRLTEKWFPNGVNTQYAWNNDNTLAEIKNRVNFSDTATVSKHTYAYDAVAQRKTAFDRVANLSAPPSNDAFAYDPIGNRTSKSDSAGPAYYIYDAANQLKEIRSGSPTGPLSAAFIYDANGNMTSKCEGGSITTNGVSSCTGATMTALSYNAINQLVQVDKTGQATQTYAYDDQGRRIAKTVGATSTQYMYNGMDIHAEYQAWSQAAARYTHGPNVDDPVIRVNATNDPEYYHQDGLGSVVATTNASGNVVAAQLYDAWGRPYATAQQGNISQYGYTGREPDETGLMYYRARYYDSTLGRFTQRDPIGLRGGINQYAYANNNPLNFTDPSGLLASDPVNRLNQNSNGTYFSQGAPDLTAAQGNLQTRTRITFILQDGFGNPFPEPGSEIANLVSPIGDKSTGALGGVGDSLLDIAPIPGGAALGKGVGALFGGIVRAFEKDTAEGVARGVGNGTGDFVSIFHGSINDASRIRVQGFDPSRGTAFVSRDFDAARNAIGPSRYEVSQGLARDPGLIESRIPIADFNRVLSPLERPYGGFFGSNLNSSEIPLRTQEAIELFNRNIVK